MATHDKQEWAEAMRAYAVSEREAAERLFRTVRMVLVEPRVVTFADWVNARTPGWVVYYRPEDGTPTY